VFLKRMTLVMWEGGDRNPFLSLLSDFRQQIVLVRFSWASRCRARVSAPDNKWLSRSGYLAL